MDDIRRIDNFLALIANACKNGEKIDSNVVTIGSIVKVNDMDFEEEVEYTIVGSAEADPYEGKISNESPVGRALLGRTIGDIVDVQVPDGVAKFEILEIRR